MILRDFSRPTSFLRSVFALWAVLAALAVSGCEDVHRLEAERSAEDLYNSAMTEMDNEYFPNAARLFSEVERQHPYSVWATRAQLMGGYAYYQALRYDDAIDTLTRFIELHPGNQNADYAFFMRAMCWYEQIADVRRDQKATQEAFDGFAEVIRRFPNTPYARDAALKLDLARDHLAAKNMDIGRWYQGQGLYIAAAGRFKEVVDRYQTTSHVAEALLRLTECYLELGMRQEATKTAAVLGYNYPDTPWYRQAYALLTPGAELALPEQPGFVSRFWNALF